MLATVLRSRPSRLRTRSVGTVRPWKADVNGDWVAPVSTPGLARQGQIAVSESGAKLDTGTGGSDSNAVAIGAHDPGRATPFRTLGPNE